MKRCRRKEAGPCATHRHRHACFAKTLLGAEMVMLMMMVCFKPTSSPGNPSPLHSVVPGPSQSPPRLTVSPRLTSFPPQGCPRPESPAKDRALDAVRPRAIKGPALDDLGTRNGSDASPPVQDTVAPTSDPIRTLPSLDTSLRQNTRGRQGNGMANIGKERTRTTRKRN